MLCVICEAVTGDRHIGKVLLLLGCVVHHPTTIRDMPVSILAYCYCFLGNGGRRQERRLMAKLCVSFVFLRRYRIRRAKRNECHGTQGHQGRNAWVWIRSHIGPSRARLKITMPCMFICLSVWLAEWPNQRFFIWIHTHTFICWYLSGVVLCCQLSSIICAIASNYSNSM